MTIIVGQENTSETFTVHEDLLKMYSVFFRSCLDSNFKEANAKCVELPEDEPRDFEVVVNWLYREPVVVEDRKWEKSTTGIPRYS